MWEISWFAIILWVHARAHTHTLFYLKPLPPPYFLNLTFYYSIHHSTFLTKHTDLLALGLFSAHLCTSICTSCSLQLEHSFPRYFNQVSAQCYLPSERPPIPLILQFSLQLLMPPNIHYMLVYLFSMWLSPWNVSATKT